MDTIEPTTDEPGVGTRIPCHETEFGFRWGACDVVRYAQFPNGSVCIGIETSGKRRLDIYVSPTGRSVRVFAHGKGEMTTRTVGDA